MLRVNARYKNIGRDAIIDIFIVKELPEYKLIYFFYACFLRTLGSSSKIGLCIYSFS